MVVVPSGNRSKGGGQRTEGLEDDEEFPLLPLPRLLLPASAAADTRSRTEAAIPLTPAACLLLSTKRHPISLAMTPMSGRSSVEALATNEGNGEESCGGGGEVEVEVEADAALEFLELGLWGGDR